MKSFVLISSLVAVAAQPYSFIGSSVSASINNGLQGFKFWSNSQFSGPSSNLSLTAFTEVTNGAQIGYINGNAASAFYFLGVYGTMSTLPIPISGIYQLSNSSGNTFVPGQSIVSLPFPGGLIVDWIFINNPIWIRNTSSATLTIAVNQPGNMGPYVLTNWQGSPSLAIPGTGFNSSVTNYLSFLPSCIVDNMPTPVSVTALNTNIVITLPHFVSSASCPIIFGSVKTSGIHSLALSVISMLFLAFISGVLVF